MRRALGVVFLASTLGLGAQPQAEVGPLVEGLALADSELLQVEWIDLGRGGWRLSGVEGKARRELSFRGLPTALQPQRATRLEARVMVLPDGPVRTLALFDQQNALVGQLGWGVRARGASWGPFRLFAGQEMVLQKGQEAPRPVTVGEPVSFEWQGQAWRLVLTQVRRGSPAHTDEPALAFDYWVWRLP